MERKQMLKLTQTALFAAIIIFMTFVPYVGYITYGPASFSITTVQIPVIIGACVLGPLYGGVLGLVWGVTSIFKSMIIGTIEVAIFTNPLVSVLPRVIVGVFAGWLFIWFCRLIKKPLVSFGIAGVLGTLTNTVLVLTAANIFDKINPFDIGVMLKTILNTAISINGVVEVAACAVLVPVIGMAVRKAQRRMSKV